MDTKKNQRGGARRGAGRPKGTSKLYTFRADKEVSALIDVQENKTEFLRRCVTKELRERRLMELGEVIPANNIKPLTLPFFDIKIVAGFPIPLSNDEKKQDIELGSMLCPHPESSYLIRVQGNSMIDAGVNDGDILIVDKSNRAPTAKEIAVCELNGEYTVKRVIEDSEGLWLVPANPEYPKIKVTEGDDFSVWGVVSYIIHKPH